MDFHSKYEIQKKEILQLKRHIKKSRKKTIGLDEVETEQLVLIGKIPMDCKCNFFEQCDVQENEVSLPKKHKKESKHKNLKIDENECIAADLNHSCNANFSDTYSGITKSVEKKTKHRQWNELLEETFAMERCNAAKQHRKSKSDENECDSTELNGTCNAMDVILNTSSEITKSGKKKRKHRQSNELLEETFAMERCNAAKQHRNSKSNEDECDSTELNNTCNVSEVILSASPETTKSGKKKRKHRQSNELLEETFAMERCNAAKQHRNSKSDKNECDSTELNNTCNAMDVILNTNSESTKSGKKRRKHNQSNELLVETFAMDSCNIVTQEKSKNKLATPKKEKRNKCDLDFLNVNPIFLETTPDITFINSLISDNSQNSDQLSTMKTKEFHSSWGNTIWNTWEIEECVDFEIPPLHMTSSLKGLGEEVVKQNLQISRGRWTKNEKKIAMRNLEDFCKQYHVKDPVELLGINSKTKNPELQRFIKAKQFYARLAKGLNNRTLLSVYTAVRNMIKPHKNSEKMSATELEELEAYHLKYGNNWVTIGEHMQRTATHCQMAYTSRSNKTFGPWSKNEEAKLIEAVNTVMGTDWSNIISGQQSVSWNKISKIVGTRNLYQCHEHFLLISWTVDESDREKWTYIWDACLIYYLHKNLVNDKTLINWTSAYHVFKFTVPSFYALQLKWKIIKGRFPNSKKASHPMFVKFLYENYLTTLMTTYGLSFEDLEERTSVKN